MVARFLSGKRAFPTLLPLLLLHDQQKSNREAGNLMRVTNLCRQVQDGRWLAYETKDIGAKKKTRMQSCTFLDSVKVK